MDLVSEIFQKISSLAYQYQNEFLVLVGGSMIVASTVISHRGRKEWKKMIRKGRAGMRGKMMNKEQVEEKYRTIQADAIFDALYKLVDEGKCPKAFTEKTLRRLANVLNMPDFVAAEKLDMKHLTTEEFELIEGILRSKKELARLLNTKKRIPIPGVKPGEVDNVHVYMPKVKALAKQAMTEVGKPKFGGNLLKAAVF